MTYIKIIFLFIFIGKYIKLCNNKVILVFLWLKYELTENSQSKLFA